MNYKRVYSEFIDDRRKREPSVSGYTEIHHIVPRCLGGGNEPKNLIVLTAEDHFFAHLLLAKSYGGRLWGAVFLMASRSRWADCIRQRRMYATARAKWAELERGKDGLKGSDNGNHNPEVFDWEHADTGEMLSLTLFDMHASKGGSRGSWTACATGANPTCLGWKIRGNIINRGHKGKTFTFINADGRRFSGRQKEFADAFGVCYPSVSRLCRHGDVTLCGWRLLGTKERKPCETRRSQAPAMRGRGKVFTFRHISTGEIVAGHRQEMSEFLGYKSAASFDGSVRCLFAGTMKSMKGYDIIKAA